MAEYLFEGILNTIEPTVSTVAFIRGKYRLHRAHGLNRGLIKNIIMSHSYFRIWLHMVFSTKDWYPFIDYSIEKKIYNYLKEQLIGLECPARIINGMPDHVHILYFQHPKISTSDVAKQIKGSSSFWINEETLTEDHFGWQTGFGVFSVSESQLQKIYDYIRNQKKHHSKITLEQEMDELLKLHKLK